MPIVTHSWNKYILCENTFYTPSMQALLQDIDHVIAHPESVLKNDRTSTVVLVKVDEKWLVIKRANTKDWTHGVRRLFSLSRAKKNWINATKLLSLGVKTFTPIAMVEERWGPFKGRSYFICSYIEGIDALHYFSSNSPYQALWPEVVQKINHLINTLSEHWISHRDLNLSNIIMVNHEPWLIDLESMREHKFLALAKRGAKRECLRFMENLKDTQEITFETKMLFHSLFTGKC